VAITSTLGVYDEQYLDMYRDRFEVNEKMMSKQTATKTKRDSRRSKRAHAQLRSISVIEVVVVPRFFCDASPCEIQNGN